MLRKSLIFFLVFSFSCQGANVVFNAVNSTNLLGEKLYLQLHQKEGNLIFSPFGIANLLAAAYYASSDATKKSFEDSLQYSDNENVTLIQFARLLKQVQDPRFILGSSVWLQSNAFKNKTEEIVRKYFGQVFYNVNFQKNTNLALDEINKWASAISEGKVPKILQESNLDPNFDILLISLFYLRGIWRTPFIKEETKEELFQIDPLKSKKVPMMHVVGEFGYSSNDRFFLIELPLAVPKGLRREISFYFLHPKVPEWMLSIEENFNIKTILQAARGMQKNNMSINLPIFDLSELISLKEPLEEIGLKAPFEVGANFSKVTKKAPVGINKFFHVAPFSINESGVEAADSPVKTVHPHKLPKNLIQFSFNRPFLFFAIDKGTGVVLLMGRVSEP